MMHQEQKRTLYFLLLFGNYLVTTAYSSIPPFFPPYAISKGLSEQNVGTILCANPIGSMLAAYWIGKNMKKSNQIKFIIFGLIVTGLGMYTFALTKFLISRESIYLLGIIARLMGGVGIAFQLTPSYAIIPIIYPEQVETKIAISELVAGIGFMSGPALGSLLYYLGGYLGPFLGIGSASFLIILLMRQKLNSITFIEQENDELLLESNEAQAICKFIQVNIQASNNENISYLSAFKIVAVLITFLANWIINLVLVFFQPTISQYLQEEYKVSQNQVGMYMSIQALTYAFGSFLVTQLKSFKKIVICFGLFLAGFSFLTSGPDVQLTGLHHDLLIVIISQAAIGLAISFVSFILSIPFMNEILLEYFPSKQTQCANMASVLFNIGLSLGEFTGPIISTTLTTYYGFERAASITGIFIIIFATCFGTIIFSKRKITDKQIENEVELNIQKN